MFGYMRAEPVQHGIGFGVASVLAATVIYALGTLCVYVASQDRGSSRH